MTPRYIFRTLARGFVLMLALLALTGVALVSFTGCATSRVTGTETVITDSVSFRQAQRMVAVSVPGDSAKLTTRVTFDEATGKFRPLTIFSRTGRTTLAFTLDAYGFIQATGFTAPFVAQVPVTDTETSRTRAATTTHTVTVAAPLGKFTRFCIGFTVVLFLGGAVWLYTRFFTPIRFFK